MIDANGVAIKKRDDLDAAYIEAHASVMRRLEEINVLAHDLPAPECDALNWSHVGSMNKVASDLREIVAFLAGKD
jgi:hypothetical protein